MTPKLLTTEQAAAHCSMNKKTFEQYRYRKVGPPYVKIGHFVRYKVEDLDRYIEQQTVTATEANQAH